MGALGMVYECSCGWMKTYGELSASKAFGLKLREVWDDEAGEMIWECPNCHGMTMYGPKVLERLYMDHIFVEEWDPKEAYWWDWKDSLIGQPYRP